MSSEEEKEAAPPKRKIVMEKINSMHQLKDEAIDSAGTSTNYGLRLGAGRP